MKANKLTLKSQEAINDAVKLAESRGNPAVDGIHLLSALLQQTDGLVLPILEKASVDTGALKSTVESELDKEPKVSGGENVTMTSALRKVFDTAEKEASRLGDEFTSTEHFLLGLLQVNSSAQRALKKN